MHKGMQKTTPLIRTRFAPSPTGLLHIGGARTALFNWLFARQNGGAFVLRFEDTDTARSNADYVNAIREDLQWLGLQWDEEIKQSDNADKHRQAAKALLASGAAYQCFCPPKKPADKREQPSDDETSKCNCRQRDNQNPPPTNIKPALRLKTPAEGESVFADAVKGEMRAARAELDDFVILRANGEPTYHLANVVDDISGNITHVIRGDDHLMNTHRQLQLFNALGNPPPVFAHLPMIMMAVDKDNAAEQTGGIVYARMSKRAAGAGIGELRANGYLPSAVINYLARLSWAAGDAEMFDIPFLLEKFSLAAINLSPARHNTEKLKWLNREHLRQTPMKDIQSMLKNHWKDGLDISDEVISLILPRAETLADIYNQSAFFRTRPQAADIDNLLAQTPPPDAFASLADMFSHLSDALSNLPKEDWTAAMIKEIIKKTAKDAGAKFPAIAMPLRIKLTATTQSPDIAQTAALLGKDETLTRLSANTI